MVCFGSQHHHHHYSAKMNRLRALFSQVFTISYFEFFTWKLAIFALVFLNLWAFFGDEALPPYGSLFHLWMLFISGHFAGKIATLFKMPALLGMMIAGNFFIEKSLLSFSIFYSIIQVSSMEIYLILNLIKESHLSYDNLHSW